MEHFWGHISIASLAQTEIDPTPSPTKCQLASLSTWGRLQGQHTDTWEFGEPCPGNAQIHVHGQSWAFKNSLICSNLHQTAAWQKTIPRIIGGLARNSSWTASWQVFWVALGTDIPMSSWEGPMYQKDVNGVYKLWLKVWVPAAPSRHQLSTEDGLLTERRVAHKEKHNLFLFLNYDLKLNNRSFKENQVLCESSLASVWIAGGSHRQWVLQAPISKPYPLPLNSQPLHLCS